MPGTTRYSATFDRTYEEEDRVDPPPLTNARRSRSASWQANTCLDGGRPYTPLGGRPPAPRSSSTDNGPGKGPEFIPTRTSKTTVKAHNNPFQFVAIGTCPLYKKAEEQLKKAKEVKKVEVLKEEEEDWQSNLDSWKSRRRKMSEDVFKRQEEIKKLEIEEQIAQISQTKQKTKTFSEMVESRATRGRALSLCLLNSPLEFQNWEYEDKTYKNGSCSLTDESGENSTVNSEDEGVSIRRRLGRGYQSENDINHRTNGDAHFEQSSTKSGFLKSNTVEDNVQIKPKESSYIDSGLESISSSHRAGDTPDSGSDFSQDSNSSIDCDSPRTGVNLLEEFSSKASQVSEGHEMSVKLCLEGKEKDFGFTFLGGKDEGDVVIASVLEGSKAALSDIHVGDKIINIDGNDVSSKKHSEIATTLKKCRENCQISLLLWRHSESAKNANDLHSEEINNKLGKVTQNAKYEKSVESENEMYVDDYEDLQRQSELLACSKTSEMTNSKSQEQTEGCKTSSNKDTKNILNGAIEETVKNEQKADSGVKNENQKKNIVKVKKVRRKGVYALNPNEISQDNTSVSSLFPLSPVTELPSPADETKTIISTLSSVNSITESKKLDENKASNKNEKNSSSVTKENKAASSTKKTDPSRAINQECSQNTVNKSVEKNTGKSTVPSSPTATKDKDIIEKNTGKSTVPSSPTATKDKDIIEKNTGKPNVPSSPTAIKNKDIIEKNTGKSTVPSSPTATKDKDIIEKNNEKSSVPSSPTVTKDKGIIEKNTGKSNVPSSPTATKDKGIIEKNTGKSNVPSSPTATKDKDIEKNTGKPNVPSSPTVIKNKDIIEKNTGKSNVPSSPTATKDKCITEKNTGKSNVASSPISTKDKDIIEKNTEKSNVPSSPTATKDKDMNSSFLPSQSEKIKSSPTKKVKVKVKKDTSSEQIPTENPLVIYDSSVSSTLGTATVDVGKRIQSKNEESLACQPQEKPKKTKLNNETSVSAVKKETTKTSVTNSPNSVVQRIAKELEAKKNEEKQISISQEISLKTAIKKDVTVSSVNKINETPQCDVITTMPTAETTSTVNDIPGVSDKADKSRNTVMNIKKNESTNSSSISQTVKKKKPKSPQSEKPKPFNSENMDLKENTSMKNTPNSVNGIKSISSSSVHVTTENSTPKAAKENKMEKEEKSTAVSGLKQGNVISKSETISPVAREKDGLSVEVVTVTSDTKHASIIDKPPIVSTSADKKRNLSLDIGVNNNAQNSTVQVTKAKSPKTPQSPKTPSEKSKPVFPVKKESTKLKEKNNVSNATTAVKANSDKKVSQMSSSPTDSPIKTLGNLSTVECNKKSDLLASPEITIEKNEVVHKPPVNLQEEKSLPPTPLKRSRSKSKKKNTNSQNINVPAKQSEELKNSNDSLNVVFQSQKSNVCLKNESVNLESSENNTCKKAISTDLVPDVTPVEKIAEEMEKMILEQLEEEERAKELSSGLIAKNLLVSPEHLLTAPPKLAEPPKEKPPPPPSTNEGSQKEPSLKRVNSTKRIKKEIHKRKSNFLGIDSADENIACSEPSIPPPPALEEILKAEIELDRQSRLKIENAATERLILEEKEIMQKEKEIIESLESEERQKQAEIDFKNDMQNMPNDVDSEEIRIESLKNERKRLETQRQLSEEQQQIHLLEEKQLREREEFIRQQEAINSAGPLSDSISVSATAANTPGLELSSSLSSKTQSNVLLLGANGDGKSISNSSAKVAENKTSEIDEKIKVSQKPAVPPKPLKKKEAIRKERERLRQEQEALQREREEHRLKLLLEQEEMMKKSHAPDAPVSRVGLLPPLVPPSFTPPQLTTTMNPAPNSREKSSFPSRSHHGAINGAVGSINAVDVMSPPVVRHNKLPTSNKAAANEACGQQKMPSVRKQNHDSLTESRYNQNHWLIQEAEMRRIAELKERQRAAQLSCSQTHLAEDDVCSNPPRVPVIPPMHNPHLNYAAQDKMWNHASSIMPLKKYPPPVMKETPFNTTPPRDTVSQKPPTKPSRVVPMEKQEQMLSVSGRKRCSHCNEELGRGAAMIIESLQLYYHIHCFQCCVCQTQLGNGSCGTDVRVRNNKLHCHNCYSNDEAGLKFSQV